MPYPLVIPRKALRRAEEAAKAEHLTLSEYIVKILAVDYESFLDAEKHRTQGDADRAARN